MTAMRVPVLIVLAILPRAAAAQRPIVEANGTVNVGYSQTVQEEFEADPFADDEDAPESSVGRPFTEIRPSISVESGSPRLIWRLAYQFSGNFAFADQSPAYSNQVDGSFIGLPSKHTTLSLSATLAQGGTAFQLTTREASQGQADVRAQGNPNLLSLTLNETLAWDAGRIFTLRQNLGGSASAPQDSLDQANFAVNAGITLERAFQRDNVGIDLRTGVARLQQVTANAVPYLTLSTALLGRWNHDFSYRWNTVMTAGVEQAYLDTLSKPLSVLPTGAIAFLYTHDETVLGIDLSHGTSANVQTGTIAIADRIGVRGLYTLNPDKLRVLSGSAGFVHNEPIGEADTLAVGAGNAVQADIGYTTALQEKVILTLRYSLAYQYGLAAGLESNLSHIFFVGVSGRISNSDEKRRPTPSIGRRVDGGDAKAFPLGGNPVGGDSGVQP